MGVAVTADLVSLVSKSTQIVRGEFARQTDLACYDIECSWKGIAPEYWI
jgi:hypothetical protein